MRVRLLIVRLRTPLRIALMIGWAALLIAALNMMLKWRPTPMWVVAAVCIWWATIYQSSAIRWIRQRALESAAVDLQGRPLVDYWGVRLIEIGVVLALSFLDFMAINDMFPVVFAWDGWGLSFLMLWPSGLGVALIAVGCILTGLHYNAAETERTVSRYRDMRVQRTDNAE